MAAAARSADALLRPRGNSAVSNRPSEVSKKFKGVKHGAGRPPFSTRNSRPLAVRECAGSKRLFERKSSCLSELARSDSGSRAGASGRRFEAENISAAASPATPSTENSTSELKYPKSINDISNGDRILGFGADLAEDHPGFHDDEYKQRRSYIAHLATTHIIGEPVPHLEYTEAEKSVWGQVLTKLSELYPTHACKEYLQTFPLFQFSPDKVPQLQEMSAILKERTGWQIRPVAGLLHPRDFLNGLAFKYFHSTQYLRHPSKPMYTPEPDLCHEVLGHLPMLADPSFAELAHAIGVASLGASEKEIWHLTKLYWYTVEFGAVREGSEVKAFGAGLLSSFGELEWLRSGRPSFLELDPFGKLPRMSYKDGFQKTYFLCASFAEVADKLKAYTKSIQRTDVIAYQ